MLSIRLSKGQTLRVEDQTYRLLKCQHGEMVMLVNEETLVRMAPHDTPIVVKQDVDGYGTDALLHPTGVFQVDQQCKVALDTPVKLNVSEFAVLKKSRTLTVVK